MRKLLLKLTTKIKSYGLADKAIRYNPFMRGSIWSSTHYSDGITFDSIAAMQQKYSQRIIAAARKTPYGKSFNGTIADWPVLRKTSLFNNYKNFLNPWVFARVPASTGGTSGIPLKLWRSLESVVAEQVFIDQLLVPYDCCMRTSPMAVLRADAIKSPDDTTAPYGVYSHGSKRLTLSSLHLNSSTIHWYHQALTEMKPRLLWAYPNAAASLMALLKQAGLSLNIPVLLVSSETLLPDTHKALEDYFHCTLINYYGQAERACFAYSTEPGVFYFNPYYGKVELQELPSVEKTALRQYKILGTGFWNRCMPLIRYDTDDVLFLPREYSESDVKEICMGLRPFDGVAGREGEYILTRDGVKIIGLNNIPREVKHIAQVQLVQHDYTTVTIHILPLPEFSLEDEQQLLKQTKAKLPADFTIIIDTKTPLFTTPRGKTPFVIKKIASRIS